DKVSALVQGAFGQDGIGVVHSNGVEPLAEHEDVGHNIARAPGNRKIVTTRAGIGVRSRETVEVPRKDQRRREIREGCWRAQALSQWTALAFLYRPIRRKQLPAEFEQSAQRDLKLLPVLQMPGNGDFPTNLAVLCVGQWDDDPE